MTYKESRQQVKNEALRSIRKIYSPKYKFPYSSSMWYDDVDNYSQAEQRENRIQHIVEDLQQKLNELKRKHKCLEQQNESNKNKMSN